MTFTLDKLWWVTMATANQKVNRAAAANGLSDRIDPGFVTPFITLSITIRQFYSNYTHISRYRAPKIVNSLLAGNVTGQKRNLEHLCPQIKFKLLQFMKTGQRSHSGRCLLIQRLLLQPLPQHAINQSFREKWTSAPPEKIPSWK